MSCINAHFAVIFKLPATILLISSCLLMPLTFSMAQESVEKELDDKIDSLIEHLSSSNFQDRQKGTRELIRIGANALPRLREHLDDEDREVRARAESIVAIIESQILVRRLDSFASAPDPDSFQFPMWTKFAEMVGKGQAAQTVFAAMIRSEHELLRTADSIQHGAQANLNQAINQRLEELQAGSDQGLERVELGTAATLLFLLSDPKVECEKRFGNVALSLIYSRDLAANLTAGFRKPILTRLVEVSFVLNDKIDAAQAVIVGQRLEIASCIPRAKLLLADTEQTPFRRQNALAAIANLGGKDALQDVEKYLNDATVLNSNRGRDRIATTTTLGDLANAACVKISGLDLAEFGFDQAQESDTSLFLLPTIGFPSEAKRMAARELWKKYKESK